jgi:CDP-diacylglycerol pyrophosphatase
MCGCDKDFVHGLVIPRTRIIGIEDPRRPDGIWSFAWDEARKHIQNDAAIALVVNPANWRSQDQLHVHIVRLLPDARRRFSDSTSVRVHSLSSVWHQAANKAARLGLQDYAVLVTKWQEGDFLVQVEEKSPEKMYTQWECQ